MDFYVSRTLTRLLKKGLEDSCSVISVASNCGQSRIKTVPLVFLPGVLLLVPRESTEDAFCACGLYHSFHDNTDAFLKVFIPVFEQMSAIHKDNNDEEEIVTPAQVAGMFVDWSDPQKAVYEL